MAREPKRKLILRKLKTDLAAIKDSGGVNPFFRKVVRCAHRPWDLDPMPAVSIWPNKRTERAAKDSDIRFDMLVQLHIVVSGSEDTAADLLEDALAVIEDWIESNTSSPGYWSRLRMEDDEIFAIAAQRDVALEKITISLIYDRAKGGPYIET